MKENKKQRDEKKGEWIKKKFKKTCKHGIKKIKEINSPRQNEK